MRPRSIGIVAVIAIATSLAGTQLAGANTVKLVDCQTLSIPSTTYYVTRDLSSCGDCLIVAADKIVIDLAGHRIIHTNPNIFNPTPCPLASAGITDNRIPHDSIVVRNGSVLGHTFGVNLAASIRVSVIGVTAINNYAHGIVAGPHSRVLASEASDSVVSGISVGDHSQVQQCNSHDNSGDGISAGRNCVITMNTANNNNVGIRAAGNGCTVSYNTVMNNGSGGIVTGGFEAATNQNITDNVAMDNGTAIDDAGIDYEISCPSIVTNNQSTSGFPLSYRLSGRGCRVHHNW
jgi:hypothetical protein